MVFDPVRAQLASDYLRIASITVWTFEVIQTIPAEYRIMSKAYERRRIALGVRMFIAVRYLGTLAMITSAVGYFGRGYSAEFCNKYQRVAPLTKVVSGLANQAVFFWRTYAISGRKPWVFKTLLVAYICAMALQIYANATTVPLQNSFNNCIATYGPGFHVSFLYYLAAMLYDFLILAISYYYLSGFAGLAWSDMYAFTRSLLTQGILYVMLSTLMNVVNLAFFELPVATSVNGMFATLGIAVTSLASQRIILNLLDPQNGHQSSYSSGRVISESGPAHLAPGARTIGGSLITGRGRELTADGSNMEMQVQVQIDVSKDHESGDQYSSHSGKKHPTTLV